MKVFCIFLWWYILFILGLQCSKCISNTNRLNSLSLFGPREWACLIWDKILDDVIGTLIAPEHLFFHGIAEVFVNVFVDTSGHSARPANTNTKLSRSSNDINMIKWAEPGRTAELGRPQEGCQGQQRHLLVIWDTQTLPKSQCLRKTLINTVWFMF